MKAKDRQTLMDIALVACGDMETVFDIAEKNDLSLTAELFGIEIDVPETVNKRVSGYFSANGTEPATDSDSDEQTALTSNDEDYILMSNDENYTLIINN